MLHGLRVGVVLCTAPGVHGYDHFHMGSSSTVTFLSVPVNYACNDAGSDSQTKRLEVQALSDDTCMHLKYNIIFISL